MMPDPRANGDTSSHDEPTMESVRRRQQQIAEALNLSLIDAELDVIEMSESDQHNLVNVAMRLGAIDVEVEAMGRKRGRD